MRILSTLFRIPTKAYENVSNFELKRPFLCINVLGFRKRRICGDSLQVAVIARNHHGFLVNHAKAITRDVKPLNYQCRRDLFELWTPYINTATKHEDSNGEPCSKRKRKKRRISELNEGESESIQHHNQIKDIIATSTASLTTLGREVGYFVNQKDHNISTCKSSCTASKDGSDTFAKDKDTNPSIFKGKKSTTIDSQVIQHSSNSPSLVLLQGGWHILPPNATCLISDASKLQPLVDLAKSKGLFDVLVIDPPWYNKSAKRSGKYPFMSLWQIKSLPVPQLLSHNALVVVWVTNKPKYIRFTRDELLPYWGIELLAEWYWVKLTRTGEFVFDLDSLHKKPYETLIIGRFKSTHTKVDELCLSDVKSQPETINRAHNMVNTDTQETTKYYMVHANKDVCAETKCEGQKHLKSIPNKMVICSVPCQAHSRKPPLSDVLKDYINKEGRFLEMFARNVLPGWTSWGNEVLKFQHIDYFEETSSTSCKSE